MRSRTTSSEVRPLLRLPSAAIDRVGRTQRPSPTRRSWKALAPTLSTHSPTSRCVSYIPITTDRPLRQVHAGGARPNSQTHPRRCEGRDQCPRRIRRERPPSSQEDIYQEVPGGGGASRSRLPYRHGSAHPLRSCAFVRFRSTSPQLLQPTLRRRLRLPKIRTIQSLYPSLFPN